MEERKRSTIGYGSSYRKGRKEDLGRGAEIGAVLGSQVWMVKPDKEAQASNPCIWMRSGAVGFKNCNNFYDCTTCKYDQGMKNRVDQRKAVSWQDAMRRRPDIDRLCRHSLTNRIQKRLCAYNYECSRCDFDQFFEDTLSMRRRALPEEIQEIRGFRVPMGYYFHGGHAWAKIESGGYVRIGLDDFASKLLGTPEALQLPLLGKELRRDRAGWGLSRDKNRADVLSPVDGVIVDVNSRARENPEVTNREPYGGGWLFMVRTRDIKGSFSNLMEGTRGLEWMRSEVGRLENMIEEVAGPLAADGGYLSNDIYGSMPDLGWTNLTRAFLKT
ncbi:MAG: glycine cleavage system protein H [Deltaproteobacteria bacterium]|nr:glycine cleavage system protein H [Deltaproteobacteria bacterium]MBW2138461.1 glycine cleavage system protein H [Deltaproteobacteria bacterium]